MRKPKTQQISDQIFNLRPDRYCELKKQTNSSALFIQTVEERECFLCCLSVMGSKPYYYIIILHKIIY